MFNKKTEPTEVLEPRGLTDDDIKAFERELEAHSQIITSKDLSYYGEPLKNQIKFNGYVNNEILGGCHWSVIDYCEKNKILAKYKTGRWYVVAEVLEKKAGGRCETLAYNLFIKKWHGLKDLKHRRLYAQKMEDEAIEVEIGLKLPKVVVAHTPKATDNTHLRACARCGEYRFIAPQKLYCLDCLNQYERTKEVLDL